MTKDEALKMAIEFIDEITNAAGKYPYVDKTSLVADSYAMASKLKEALEQPEQEVKCNPHPDAPHGFMRDESHSQDRYVCECEYWTPPAQEPVGYVTNSGLSAVFNLGVNLDDDTPLYTNPAPSWQGNKEFVGLSDDERFIIVQNADWDNPYDIAELIEQALKDKNS